MSKDWEIYRYKKVLSYLQSHPTKSDDMVYQIDRLEWIIDQCQSKNSVKDDGWETPILESVYESIKLSPDVHQQQVMLDEIINVVKKIKAGKNSTDRDLQWELNKIEKVKDLILIGVAEANKEKEIIHLEKIRSRINEAPPGKDNNWQLAQMDKLMGKIKKSIHDSARKDEIAKLTEIKDSIKKVDKTRQRKWEISEIDKVIAEMKTPPMAQNREWEFNELTKILAAAKEKPKKLTDDWECDELELVIASVMGHNKEKTRDWDMEQ